MTSTILTLIWESTLSMVGKVAWNAVFERFYTRLVIYGLNRIKDMNTNTVVNNTVQDILYSLKGKKLKVIDEELQ